MVVYANGILNGARIDLDGPVTGLPDGAPVSLTLALRDDSMAEKHRLIDDLCGSWKDDPSLERIFTEIIDSRSKSAGRDVSFDDPS